MVSWPRPQSTRKLPALTSQPMLYLESRSMLMNWVLSRSSWYRIRPRLSHGHMISRLLTNNLGPSVLIWTVTNLITSELWLVTIIGEPLPINTIIKHCPCSIDTFASYSPLPLSAITALLVTTRRQLVEGDYYTSPIPLHISSHLNRVPRWACESMVYEGGRHVHLLATTL
jgi:hypothetical protein